MKEKIEKLKEKIKAKPKLYKTLKVIYFLCNLGAYLIALFTILTLSIGSSCSNQSNEVLAYGDYKKHTPKEAFSFNQYDLYGTAELSSISAIENYLSYMSQLGVDYLSLTSSYTHHFVVNGSCWFVDSLNLTPSNITTANTREFTIQEVQLIGEPIYVNDNSSTRQWITLAFTSTTNANDKITYDFCRIWNTKLNGTYTWYNLGMYRNVNGTREVVSTQSWSLVTTNQGIMGASLRLFLPWAINESTQFSNGRNIGYTTGYQNGRSVGYNNGYQQGFSDGVASVTGTSSNPFSLLSEAFEAVADFLDIQILPGLNIGVLIFAPLVVTIIVVIIKMFRG